MEPEETAVLRRAGRPRELRTWLPFLAFLGPALLLSAWYVQRTYVDVVMLDGLAQVPFVDQVLDGHPHLQDVLATPFGMQHFLLAYRFMMIVNAWLFGLDMRLDPVLFVVAYAVTAALIYAEVAKVLGRRRPWILLAVFLPLGFLCFSLVAPPLILMTTQFVWATAVGLGIAFLAQRGLYDDRRKRAWIAGMALVPLYFLFSGGYFPGFVLGLVAMQVARSLLQPCGWLDRRFLALFATVMACAVIYTAGYFTFVPQGSGEAGGIQLFVRDVGHSALGYLAGLSGAVFDSHTLETTPSPTLVAIGAAMAVTTALALWLFVRTRMFERTYLPIYCIFYSVGVTTAVRLGRGPLSGWRGITAEWYAFHLRFIVVGVVWILLYVLLTSRGAGFFRLGVSPARRRVAFMGIAAGLTFVAVGQVVGNQAQWVRAPYVKAWFAEKQQALLFPDAFPNDAAVLLWPAADVDRARAALQEHHLSSFRDVGAGGGRPVFDGDWYGDGWVGKSGRALILVDSGRQLQVRADFSDFLPSNHVTIRLGQQVLFSGEIQGGTTRTFQARLAPGGNVLEVTAQDAVSPASSGNGADERPLAVHIKLS